MLSHPTKITSKKNTTNLWHDSKEISKEIKMIIFLQRKKERKKKIQNKQISKKMQ